MGHTAVEFVIGNGQVKRAMRLARRRGGELARPCNLGLRRLVG